MFRKILVLVRGHDPSQPAVQRAVACAGRSTELELLDVVHEPALDGYLGNSAVYEPLRARVVAERADDMKKLVATLSDRGLDVRGEAVWAHPLDEAIAERVRPKGVDLVVAATSQAPGGGLSSSDWRLVTTCPAPVLIVRGPADRRYRHIVAAVDPYHAHAKPAELDLAILEQARKLQAQSKAALCALHCFTPLEYFGADLAAPPGHVAGADGRREELEALVRRSGLPASYARLEAGTPQGVLKSLEERGEADVIVMGALSRGRLKDWIIGSTAERVLHAGGVDVLAVKPAQLR